MVNTRTERVDHRIRLTFSSLDVITAIERLSSSPSSNKHYTNSNDVSHTNHSLIEAVLLKRASESRSINFRILSGYVSALQRDKVEVGAARGLYLPARVDLAAVN